MASEIFQLVGRILIDGDAADKSLSKTEASSKNLASSLGSGISTAVKFGAALGTAAIAAGAALYGVTSKAVEATDRIDKMSAKIGVSKQGFQEWSYILGQNGMDVDKLQVGMKTLTSQMDAAAEGNKAAKARFDELGLSWEDGTGKLKSQEQMMNEAILSLAKMENGTEKSRLATELFGKAGQEMMPMLNNGAEGIEQLRDRAHELGLVMSDEAVTAGVVLGDTMDDVKQSFSAIVTKIGVEAMPIFQGLCDWVLSAMPTIQAILGTVFDFIGNGVSSVIDFIAMLKAAAADWVADNQTTVDMVVALVQRIVDFFKSAVAWIMEGFAAFGAWLGAFWAENGAAMIETITAVINSIMDFFSAFFAWCSEFWAMYGSNIMAIIQPIWDGICSIFSAAFNIIKGIFDVFAAIFKGDWSAMWSALGNILETIGKTLVSLVGNIVTAIIEALKLRISMFMNAGKAMFQAVWDGMKSIWDGIVGWVSDAVNWLVDKLAFWRKGKSEMNGSDGSHATGLTYVPFDGYRAILHKGERVLTAEENANGYSREGGDTYNQTNNFYNCKDMSETEAAAQQREMLRKLQEGF